jgi:ATP-binding cassette subfamily G (WHITE) protein 2 (PDR)
MASIDKKHELRPDIDNTTSTDTSGNIVKDNNSDGDGDYEKMERPNKWQDSNTSSTTDSAERNKLRRSQTSQSAHQRHTFSPINPGDTEELLRIATSLENEGASAVRTSTRGSELQRRDSLAGIHMGDAVLDPKSPEFDVYKWARM